MAVSEAQSLEEGYQHSALQWEQDRAYNSYSCDIQFCVATHEELHPFPHQIPIGQKRAGENVCDTDRSMKVGCQDRKDSTPEPAAWTSMNQQHVPGSAVLPFCFLCVGSYPNTTIIGCKGIACVHR